MNSMAIGMRPLKSFVKINRKRPKIIVPTVKNRAASLNIVFILLCYCDIAVPDRKHNLLICLKFFRLFYYKIKIYIRHLGLSI